MAKSLPDRFWSKVNKTDGCWLWTGAVNDGGYGVLRRGPKSMVGNFYAHRIAYELTHGPIPDGLWALHRCDVRRCVNPDHLFLGTHADNTLDALNKRRFAVGEAHGRAVLTLDIARAIIERNAAGVRRHDIASALGVKLSAVHDVASGRIWRHASTRPPLRAPAP